MPPTDLSPEQIRRAHMASGALGGLAMLVAMLLMRNVTETRSLVEIVAGSTLQLMPIALFSFLLGLFQGLAKPILLASVMAGFVIAGALVARFDGGPARTTGLGGKTRRALLLAVSVWVPSALVALFATVFGTTIALTNRELIDLGWTTLVDAVVFATITYMSYPIIAGEWYRAMPGTDHPPENLGRRRLIGQMGSAVVALAGVAYLGRFVADARSGVIGGGRNQVPAPITPNGEFYVVSKNFMDPDVSLGNWQLDIRGLVDTPVTITYEELAAMPTVEQEATLICISNEVGGDLISNARWTGVRLSDILARAGIRPQAQKLAFFGTDGYSDSFPLSKAFEPTTIVAILMNGEPLSDKHGFPARLIVPGKYGIKNGKWLRRLELVERYRGYWQERGWTEDATINTMSRFDVPGERAIVEPRPLELGGVAFAGDRGVQDVEISTDNGRTWQPADSLQQIAPLSWAIWRTTWTPPGPGAYSLRVRAIDGTGAAQTEERADPIPDGASGHHRVDVGVT